jgi:hypothetical protein
MQRPGTELGRADRHGSRAIAQLGENGLKKLVGSITWVGLKILYRRRNELSIDCGEKTSL